MQTSHSCLYCILLNRFCWTFIGVHEVVQKKLDVVLCLWYWLHVVTHWRLFRECNWLLLCCFYTSISKHYQYGSSNIVQHFWRIRRWIYPVSYPFLGALFSPDGYITTCLWFWSFLDPYLNKIHVFP